MHQRRGLIFFLRTTFQIVWSVTRLQFTSPWVTSDWGFVLLALTVWILVSCPHHGSWLTTAMSCGRRTSPPKSLLASLGRVWNIAESFYLHHASDFIFGAPVRHSRSTVFTSTQPAQEWRWGGSSRIPCWDRYFNSWSVLAIPWSSEGKRRCFWWKFASSRSSTIRQGCAIAIRS